MKSLVLILSVLPLLSGCSDSEQPAPPPAKTPAKAKTPVMAKPPGPPANTSGKANWMLAEGRNAAGETSILRYIRKPLGWASLPEQVSISWKYDGALPDRALLKKMDELEDALQSLWDTPDSCLALVRTNPGLREWFFYCHDYPAFMEEVNGYLAGRAAFPVSFARGHDPEWQNWHRIVDPVKKKK